MRRMLKGFIKGVGVGMIPGMAAGAAAVWYLHRNRRGLKRHVGRALRSAGDLVDNVMGIF